MQLHTTLANDKNLPADYNERHAENLVDEVFVCAKVFRIFDFIPCSHKTNVRLAFNILSEFRENGARWQSHVVAQKSQSLWV